MLLCLRSFPCKDSSHLLRVTEYVHSSWVLHFQCNACWLHQCFSPHFVGEHDVADDTIYFSVPLLLKAALCQVQIAEGSHLACALMRFVFWFAVQFSYKLVLLSDTMQLKGCMLLLAAHWSSWWRSHTFYHFALCTLYVMGVAELLEMQLFTYMGKSSST